MDLTGPPPSCSHHAIHKSVNALHPMQGLIDSQKHPATGVLHCSSLQHLVLLHYTSSSMSCPLQRSLSHWAYTLAPWSQVKPSTPCAISASLCNRCISMQSLHLCATSASLCNLCIPVQSLHLCAISASLCHLCISVQSLLLCALSLCICHISVCTLSSSSVFSMSCLRGHHHSS